MVYPNKPPSQRGYSTTWLANASPAAAVYKPFNGYMLSGAQSYAPWAPSRGTILNLTFSAPPADGEQLMVLDGPPNAPGTPTDAFTYVYGGSPGVGIIPLVSGGGTAAQAATATQVALAAQLNNWIVTNPSSGVVTLQSKYKGLNLTAAQIATMIGTIAGLAIVQLKATPTPVLPGRRGIAGYHLTA